MSIAPQFLVADLQVAIDYYRDRLGFEQKIAWEDFYASVIRDGAEIHLKCAPGLAGEREHRRVNDHIDAMITVADAESLFEEISGRGALIHQTLETQPWGARDFIVLDPDGHIVCFAEDAGG
jgi:uncharacterized glyoxalase superfamily protein PhnB